MPFYASKVAIATVLLEIKETKVYLEMKQEDKEILLSFFADRQ